MEGFERGALGGQSDRLRALYFRRNRDGGSEELDRELVRLVLEHAKRVVAHPSRPVVRKTAPFLEFPYAELALEETIEESPLLASPEDFLVEFGVEKPFSCSAILDCSSSMSGDKHLLASIAVAVLLLKVRPRDASLVVFASDSIKVKPMLLDESPETTVLKFLKSAPKGFTNIAKGLETGLDQARRATAKRTVGLIATDGRTTEGGDPLEVAKQFDFLVVLHLHGPGSHLEASKEMAQRGHGVCLEVERFEELPRRMYDAIRWLSCR